MTGCSAAIRWVVGTPLLAGLLALAPPEREPVRVAVFDQALLRWDREHPELVMADGYVLRFRGQTVERSIELPPPPARPVDTPRITATVRVQPVSSALDSRPVPNDPWNRLGRVAVLAPGPDGGKPLEVELVRFVTGFGAASVHEQDVTPLAPLLHGRRTLRAFVSTYSEKPGWTISVTLTYSWEDTGYRRPALARPLFDSEHLTAAAPRLSGTIRIPPGLARPRVRVITTGHATDGAGGNEFVSSPHVLRIDGREVARWRPWSERGTGLRPQNPWAGRDVYDGRELWSSDFDRTGWHPGLDVPPLTIPVPELTPGPHRVELEVTDIRPKDPDSGHHGYWVVNAAVVADEPWAAPAGAPEEDRP